MTVPRFGGLGRAVRWALMTLVLAVFGGLLLVNGFLDAEFGADGRVAPQVSNSRVPDRIIAGGPVILGDGHTERSVGMPDRTVLLTFDDGPDPEWTPQVLTVLRRQRVPATFFVVGSRVAEHPDLLDAEYRAGNEIGLHTFSHPDLVYQSQRRKRLEMSQSQLALAGAAGVTSSVFRPPYSSRPDAVDNRSWPVIKELTGSGYVVVLSSSDSEDWKTPGVSRIVHNAIPPGHRGAIVLMHDLGPDRSQTVAALDRLITVLKGRGYRFRTVGQLLHQDSNPPAAPAERRRGRLLLASVRVAHVVATGFAGLLYVVGALVILRLLLMLLVASRHAKRRRAPGWSWGPPVTEPVSVVVPAYNEGICIADTVGSLVASDHPVEIIVVDDGSTDGTAEIAEGLGHPNVTVVRKPNGGKSSALNLGIAYARRELIVMMDGDTVFEPQTVRRLVQPFADPRVGAVAGNAKVANRGSLVGGWQHIEYVIGFNVDRRVYDVWRCMPTVAGAVGAFRRTALRQVDGVSDATLAEDTDLTMAMCRAGWRVVYEERARAWTEAPATLAELWRQRYRWSYGTMQSMWKHRRAAIERGPSGRLGRRGLVNLALFQILLPLVSPLVDVFLLYGIAFLNPARTVLAWLAMLAVQLVTAGVAFRLDGESLRVLWRLPIQQFVYRQLMYTVMIRSMLAALGGVRMRWHKLNRTGGLNELLSVGRGG